MTTTLRITDCDEAFAVPGDNSIIDCINPNTGLSWIAGETLEQVRLRYPGAEVVNMISWMAEKARLQDSPIEWQEITEEKYFEMLEVLPPAAMRSGAFLIGEPWDHHATTGLPRFQAFNKWGDKCQASSRPMTKREFFTLFN